MTDKLIIGAGLYGLYAALYCGKKGQQVKVLELEDEPFSRATYVNQARVHMGYHYPRSLSTAMKSAGYFRRFVEDYAFCIRFDFQQVYATSKHFSWTDAREFTAFCKNAGIPCEPLPAARYFQEEVCDGAFLTKEYTYDAHILRDYFLEQLGRYKNVELLCGREIQRIIKKADRYEVIALHQGKEERYEAPFVLNATYASVNQVLSKIEEDIPAAGEEGHSGGEKSAGEEGHSGGEKSAGAEGHSGGEKSAGAEGYSEGGKSAGAEGHSEAGKTAGAETAEPFGIKYELCEIILCRVNDKLKDLGLTVMDGPFFSIMPFGKTGLHSLTSVTFTPHKTSRSRLPEFPCMRDGKCGKCIEDKDFIKKETLHEEDSRGEHPTYWLGNCNLCENRPESAWEYMSALARKYVKEEYRFAYERSLFSMKPVLKAAEIDDSRPTVIRYASRKPTFLSVLSGKINTVYDLDEFLDED